MTTISADQEFSILDALAAAGGEAAEEGDGGSIEAEALYERRREREDAQVHTFTRTFKYRPWDGAVAFQQVLLRLFGTAGVGATAMTMFGPSEPELREVPVGLEETIQVPWGKVEFPIFGEEAYFFNRGNYDEELGPLYELRFSAPKKFGRHIRGLFKQIELELEENSIYRGKAFDGREMPQFLDLSLVDPRRVIYSEEVTAALEADVWALVEKTELMRDLGVPLKHAVLLEGEYGTGKTLAGMVTAQKAMAAETQWTFIQCRPGLDDYDEVISTARLYQPCVVFFEDVDTIASTGNDDELTRLLDVYDGATSKGAEILVVLTTNHADQIHKGMIRPGRIDRVISIGRQDASSIRRLIETSVSPDLLPENIEYERIAAAMDGFTPAFVKEAIHRTMRHAAARVGGRPGSFVEEDFISAASSLRPHQELMDGASEGKVAETLEAALARVFAKVLTDTMVVERGSGTPLWDLQAKKR